MDAEFINRTKRMDITATEGEPLPLDGQLVSRLVNAGVRAGCKLLEFVDGKLTDEPEKAAQPESNSSG